MAFVFAPKNPFVGMPARMTNFLSPQQGDDNLTFDRNFILLAMAMYAIGMIMVASSSMPIAERLFDNPFHFIIRHSIYIVLSIGLAGMFLQCSMDWWLRSSGYLLLLAILLLITVLIIGRSVNGSTRWIVLGPITIQAAEPAKLLFFCYLSSYLVRRREQVAEDWRGFVKPIAVLFVLSILLLRQPDLGTVIVMFATSLGLLFLAGAKLWQFALVFGTAVGSAILLIVFEPYRWRRVTSFLDPWEDPFGSGYQLTQSLMAYGRGDLWGEGLGNSIQKLEYLPEAHTDFVMAVLAEEFGFVGIVIVLMLSLVLVLKALLLGRKALAKEKFFEGYFAYGIGIWFSFQTAVNIGASAGILPTKGLTMPLISYGGSSMIVMTMAMVILIRIDHELRLASMQAIAKPGVKRHKPAIKKRARSKAVDERQQQLPLGEPEVADV